MHVLYSLWEKNLFTFSTSAGMNAQLTYLIPPGIADNKFKVGLTSGDITTNATLDREVQDSWVITGREPFLCRFQTAAHLPITFSNVDIDGL